MAGGWENGAGSIVRVTSTVSAGPPRPLLTYVPALAPRALASPLAPLPSQSQTFNQVGINVNSGMLVLSTFAILMPSLLDATHTEVGLRLWVNNEMGVWVG